jgi:hypothetical protein
VIGAAATFMLEFDGIRIKRSVQRNVDRLQNAFDVFRHIIVPEADDTVTLPLQPPRSVFVSRYSRVHPVLRTVDLNDEVRSHTREVCDIWTDRDLATEVCAEHW